MHLNIKLTVFLYAITIRDDDTPAVKKKEEVWSWMQKRYIHNE